jgi:hypothetical protein
MYLEEKVEPRKALETEPDAFELESLIAWLEKQPARKTYDYVEPFGCLLYQYFKAMKLPIISIGPYYYRTHKVGGFGGFGHPSLSHDEYLLPHSFHEIAYIRPHTFGAALKRAKSHR